MTKTTSAILSSFIVIVIGAIFASYSNDFESRPSIMPILSETLPSGLTGK
mgnify:CR=1 FL=1